MIPTRRAVMLTVALAALFPALVTTAQHARNVPTIGVTLVGSVPNPYAEALRRGLADLGWVEGQNIRIEYRYAEGRLERFPAFMAELVRLKVDVIVAGGGGASLRAAMAATSTVPIVVPLLGAPVTTGLTRSLARPTSNVTGQSQVEEDLNAKRAELLSAVIPRSARVGVLVDPSGNPQTAQILARTVPSALRSLGLRSQVFSVSRMDDVDGAFEAIRASGAEGLIVTASALFNNHRQRLVDLSVKHRLAAVFENRSFVEAGGLMSYGVDVAEMYRGAARYVDKILKGAKPADLPIEEPTKFEMAINLKTVKTLGLNVPRSLLLRADHHIE